MVLAALDRALHSVGRAADPSSFGIALELAASARTRTGELAPRLVRDLREGAGDPPAGTPSAFYLGVWNGIELLTALDRHAETAVFDGIVSTEYSAEWRTGSGLSHQRAAIAHARAALGPERYEAAFQTGAAMTYEQAVEHILRVLDDLVNETSLQS